MVLSPYTRIVWMLLMVIGTLLCKSLPVLAIMYLVGILPIITIIKLINMHIKMFLIGIVPIFLSYILLYIVIYNYNYGGWTFIFNKVLKLVIITTVIQISITIPNQLLVTTFRKLGFKGEKLLTLIGAFTVWFDIRNRTDKIITARFARGFIKKRTTWNTIKQLPFVFIPLITGILRTSTERAESWEQKDIFKLLESYKPEKQTYSIFFNFLLIIISCFWFGFNLINKV